MDDLELHVLSDSDHIAVAEYSSRRDHFLVAVLFSAADESAVDIGARSGVAVSDIDHWVVLLVKDDSVELEMHTRDKGVVDNNVTSTSQLTVPRQLTKLDLLVIGIAANSPVVVGVQKDVVCKRG